MENKTLWSKSQKEYGANYDKHLLELYKLFVETSENVTEKRANSNKFFLTINSAIIGIVSFFAPQMINLQMYLFFMTIVVGIVICILWINMIKSYKQLNGGKFVVIHELEKQLPVKLFDFEWQVLEQGKDKTKYKKLTEVEKKIPFVFITLYILLAIFIIINYFN